jgi:hypothetical protein
MRTALLVLFALSLTTAPVSAVDYSQFDRKIAREPAYRSKNPRYGLLLFGPKAALRVWLVLDGEELYLDRNGDGDLTGKDKHMGNLSQVKDVTLADPDGKTKYVITSINSYQLGKPPEHHLMVNVDIRGPLSYRQYCDLKTVEKPSKAALAHFHGPLTAGPRTINWKVPSELTLPAGEKPGELYVMIGTMSAEHGCWVVVRNHNGNECAFAREVRPVVEVEFPAKAPGGKAVKRRCKLDAFC